MHFGLGLISEIHSESCHWVSRAQIMAQLPNYKIKKLGNRIYRIMVCFYHVSSEISTERWRKVLTNLRLVVRLFLNVLSKLICHLFGSVIKSNVDGQITIHHIL